LLDTCGVHYSPGQQSRVYIRTLRFVTESLKHTPKCEKMIMVNEEPSSMKQIRLRGERAAGRCALVSDADYPKLVGYKWHIDAHGYVVRHVYLGKVGEPGQRRSTGAVVKMHRQVTHARPGESVDHINHDKLDNQRTNLRRCTNHQNCMNMPLSKANKSGFKGVRRRGDPGSWYARIKFDGQEIYIGRFGTAEEAAMAYDQCAQDLFGEYAFLNGAA
jgi:hypothetical protein